MKNIAVASRVKVSADGHGVVSHAGMGMLRELADLTGLSTQVTAALADTYRGQWIYEPGAVFADLAAAVADGVDCIDGVGQSCGDREHVLGPAASTTTMWRLVDTRIDADHLPEIRAARAHARAAAWAAGAAPDAGQWLHLDVDATITMDHSDNKENAGATWKKTYGHHPLLVFLDRPEIAGGEALAGLLRPGNAGSNTAADHVTVLRWALESLPVAYRPDPDDPGAQQVLVRSDSAAATHTFAAACRTAGVGFSFGYPVDTRVRGAVEILNANDGWYPAIESGDGIRDGAWVAEATDLVDMSRWPTGTRLILRKERPAPRGAAAVHRLRRAAGHRLHHRHRTRSHRGPARRAGTAAPPTRPGGGPNPPSQGHRAAEPPVSPLRCELGMAGNHHGSNRFGGPVATDRIRRPTGSGQQRDRHLPLPGSPCRRPHHPRRPPNPTADRRHLAMGHRHRPRMATTSGSLHLTPNPPSTRPEEPPALESPHPSDTGRPVIPTCNHQATQSASTDFNCPDQAARKIEANIHPTN